MSLILTYGQCFVEEWHASCWCLGCFTFDLPRTYNRNWFCRNALMGLMFGTDELWLFFQNNIKKIHHVFLHPSSCWSRFCTDKLGTKALNLRKNILSSQELLTWLLLHWNCHELSAETLHMIKTFQKRQKIQQLDHSIGSHHLCCVFSLRPAPPPTPEPTHQFRWLLELGRLATSFLHFEAIQLWTRILWESNDFMCHVWILWVSQCFLYKDNTCNFGCSFPSTSHVQPLHPSLIDLLLPWVMVRWTN